MKLKPAILALSAVMLIGFATTSDARRFGGGRSSGYSTATTPKKTASKVDEPSEAKGTTVNINMPSLRSSSGYANTTAMPAGAAAGAAVTTATASNLSPEEAKKAREKRVAEDELVRQAAEERKAREAAEEVRKKEEQERLAAAAAAARAERERREQQQAERRAQIEKEKEIERQRQARLNSCAFKPVMTDEEMARCREVLR